MDRMNFTTKKIIHSIFHPRRSIRRTRELIREWQGYAPEPISANILPTMLCNFQCRMCTVWRMLDTASEESRMLIKMEYVRKFVDDLSRNPKNFTLIGGEPFLHPQWEGIVSYIKNKGHSCSIITNGWLLEKYSQAIINSKLDVLDVSLDGREEINDSNRKKGSFKQVIMGIQQINHQKKECNATSPTVNIIATIDDLTYKSLSDLIDICNKLRVNELRLIHLIYYTDEVLKRQHYEFKKNFIESSSLKPLKENTNEYISSQSFIPEKIDTQLLLAEINKIRKANKSFNFAILPNYSDEEIIKYYTEEDYHRPEEQVCKIPYQTLTLLPNGFIELCMGYRVGHINDDNVLNIWNNKYFRNFRKIFRRTGRLPICHRCCN